MRVCKIISVLILAGLFYSCGGGVSQKDYDELKDENKLLKESIDATHTSVLNQAATINKTLSELAEISGNTMALRGDIENGVARVTQAEQISRNIKAIKNKISSLEKQVGNDSAYKKIVSNLKTIIKEKEAEINSLKEIIENQNTTITEQKSTIEQQGQRLNNQQEKLKQAVKVQAKLLYQAAGEFEQFAEDVPDVSKKKNKKKVNDWAISMLSRSLLYYQESQKYGIDASSDISRVQKRIVALRKAD